MTVASIRTFARMSLTICILMVACPMVLRADITGSILGTVRDASSASMRFFHGPGIENFDLGLQKVTRVRENMSVQFRAEFFNAFEHAQFGNPSGSFISSNFGRVTSTRSLGRIGQMSLKFLW